MLTAMFINQLKLKCLQQARLSLFLQTKTEMKQEDDLQKLVLMLEANIEDESLRKYISMNIGQ